MHCGRHWSRTRFWSRCGSRTRARSIPGQWNQLWLQTANQPTLLTGGKHYSKHTSHVLMFAKLENSKNAGGAVMSLFLWWHIIKSNESLFEQHLSYIIYNPGCLTKIKSKVRKKKFKLSQNPLWFNTLKTLWQWNKTDARSRKIYQINYTMTENPKSDGL